MNKSGDATSSLTLVQFAASEMQKYRLQLCVLLNVSAELQSQIMKNIPVDNAILHVLLRSSNTTNNPNNAWMKNEFGSAEHNRLCF